MKYKAIALVLALGVAAWAQTATQSAPAGPDQKSSAAESKAASRCCEKMASADAKDAASCCAHHAKDAATSNCCAEKDAASCCQGKDGKSCDRKDKSAAGAGEGKECMKNVEKGSCNHTGKEKAGANCCRKALAAVPAEGAN